MSLRTFSQSTLTRADSSEVCIPKEDAKIIFKDLKKFKVLKEIKLEQDTLVLNLKSKISGYKRETSILIDKNTEQQRSISRKDKTIKILGFTVKFGLPVGLVGGFVLGMSLN